MKCGHKPGELVHYSTANQFLNSRHAGSKYMLGARNTRDHHSKRPKEIRKKSSISYDESLQPMVRSSSIAVIEMAANEPKELVESLRPAGVSIQAPIHLSEKKTSKMRVRSAEEGLSGVMAFRINLKRGRSQPRIHVSAASFYVTKS